MEVEQITTLVIAGWVYHGEDRWYFPDEVSGVLGRCYTTEEAWKEFQKSEAGS